MDERFRQLLVEVGEFPPSSPQRALALSAKTGERPAEAYESMRERSVEPARGYERIEMG